MKCLARLSILALLAAPAAARPVQESAEPFELTADSLQQLVDELHDSIGDVPGLQDPPLTIRLATVEEAEEALYQENLPAFQVHFGESDEALGQARQFARGIATVLLAKYAYLNDEVLVMPTTIETSAKILEQPALRTRGVLRALLVHELVHRADHLDRDAFAPLREGMSFEAVSAYNAVLEGHAQHRARLTCRDQGWDAGFEDMTRAMGTVPDLEDVDEALAMMMRLQANRFTTFYIDGERFIRAIFESGGEEQVARAFREPPQDTVTILHPEWYLEPGTRPVSPFDFEAALDDADGLCPAEGWSKQRLTMTTEQVKLAMGLLPEEVVERLAKGLTGNRVGVCSAMHGSAQLVFALYEFSSPEEARFYVDSALRINKVKDEGDMVQLESVVYTDLEAPAPRGFAAEKKGSYLGQALDVATVTASAGPVAVELLTVNSSVGLAELRFVTERALRIAQGISLFAKLPRDDAEDVD